MVVHRLLAAALRLLPLPDAVREREELHALADNLNARHRGAQARKAHPRPQPLCSPVSARSCACG